MKDNLKRFGNDMPSDWNYETNLSSAARNSISRIVIESTSDIAQVKLVPGLVEMLPAEKDNDDHNTAIVLADKNLFVLFLPAFLKKPRRKYHDGITLKMTAITAWSRTYATSARFFICGWKSLFQLQVCCDLLNTGL